MLLLSLAALSAGAFAFTFALWATGYGAVDPRAAARLGRLRGEEERVAPRSDVSEEIAKRRRRTAVTIGTISLVPTKLATRWCEDLTRAGLTLRAKEYFIMRLLGAAGVGLVGYALFPFEAVQFLGGLAGLAAGFALPAFFVRHRIGKRKATMEAQILEFLPLVASGLRSGFGLVQALTSASDQLTGPLRDELDHLLRDIQVGASIEDAFDALRERVGSPDFDVVVTAILIQRAVGGNLANILDNVAETMRERARIRGEIRALTAQQRLTGLVIGSLPVALFVLFWFLNPEFEKLLLTTDIGRFMFGIGVIAELTGFLVILKIVRIEV